MNSKVEQDRSGMLTLIGQRLQHALRDDEPSFLVPVRYGTAILTSLASQPPVLDEREVIERCAKVAEQPRRYFVVGSDVRTYVTFSAREAAEAIRNLGGPDA